MRAFLLAGILGLALLLSGPGAADTSPDETTRTQDGCVRLTMCEGQTATGACDTIGDGTGDEIVAELLKDSLWAVSLYGTQSSGNYTCTLKTNDAGYDALSGEGADVHDTSLSQSDQAKPLSGLLDHAWVECSTIATSVTITISACPLGK